MYYNYKSKFRQNHRLCKIFIYSFVFAFFYFIKICLFINIFLIKLTFKFFKKIISPILKLNAKFLLNIFSGFYRIFLNYKLKKKAVVLDDKKDFFSFVSFIFSNRASIHFLILMIIFIVIFNNVYIRDVTGIEIPKRSKYIFKPQIKLIEEDLEEVEVVISDSEFKPRRDVIRAYPIISSKLDYQGFVVLEKRDTLSNLPIEDREVDTPKRKEIITYTVKPKDTIYDIAIEYGIDVDTILWANNLTQRSIIKPGQKLLIPPVSGVIHIVKKGDSISRIAKIYKAKIQDIKKFNNIDENTILRIGQKIIVPGGKKPVKIYLSKKYKRFISKYIPKVKNTPGFLWPNSCRRISQYFKGWRHAGIDIACRKGSPIRAAADGIVEKAGWNSWGYGYRVVIRHSNKVKTLYAHMLSNLQVYPGQKVKKGQIIGYEGSTGRSTGPHLHFEIIINGRRVNPLNYF